MSKLQEYQSVCKELDEIHQRLTEAMNRKSSLAYQLRSEYELSKPRKIWTVVGVYNSTVNINGTDVPSLKLELALENKAEVLTHAQTYGQTDHNTNEVSSVTYFRLNNLLLMQGSGTVVMKPFSHCSDIDWMRIQSGSIPDHLNNMK